jgi:hypothetical protein
MTIREIDAITKLLDEFAPLDTDEHKTLSQRVADEISDYKMVMDHCSEIYMHCSGGRISKPQTMPFEVIGILNDEQSKDIDEAITEARAAWESERPLANLSESDIRDLFEILRYTHRDPHRLTGVLRLLRETEVGYRADQPVSEAGRSAQSASVKEETLKLSPCVSQAKEAVEAATDVARRDAYVAATTLTRNNDALSARLKVHAHELLAGGANASELRADLFAASELIAVLSRASQQRIEDLKAEIFALRSHGSSSKTTL